MKQFLNNQASSASKAASVMRGASLIELMIGMVLGLVVVLVVTQVLSFSEGQRRTTTGGADAQVNGALAVYSLQREIQMAGYGLTTDPNALGCDVRAAHAVAGNFVWSLVPVVIMDGANGAPDSIAVMSASRSFSVPMTMTVDRALAGDRFVVNSALGVDAGDLVIAVPQGYVNATNWCTAFGVDGVANTNQLMSNGASAWNQTLSAVLPAGGYLAGTRLLNTGALVNRTFSLSAALSLQQQTRSSTSGAANVEELFPQIVNLQALYGKDTNGDGAVDTYDNVTPTTNAGWRQVLTIRLALVARSATFQKEEVTQAQPQWDVGGAVPVAGAAACGTSSCITLKVDGLADWKHYRYSVYGVVIPLRNMLWGS